MTDSFTTRLSQAIVKAKRGESLSAEERQAIQEGMKGVAPASREYQMLSEALAAAGPSSLPETDNTWGSGNTPNLRQPTMDWAAGLGRVKDAITDEFSDPFGGNPDLRSTYNAAEQNDVQGSAPIGTNTEVSQTGGATGPTETNSDPLGWEGYDDPNGGVPGPTLAAGWGNDTGNFNEDDVADVNAVNFPGGYSFSGSNETAVDMFKYNPELMNRNLVENVLGQDTQMAPYWENKTKAAMQMASYGLLGNGSGRSDLGGGPTTSTGQLAATEDFMKQFAAPGVQTVDPGQVYQQIFDRAVNTDWSTQTGREGGPMGPEEMIQTTNNALLTSMGFSNPETEQWMTSLLENAAMEYMMYLAQGGDTSVSYPKFLDETMGFSDLL
jgi:hypothetical protein